MICDHEKNMTHINRAPGKLDGKKKRALVGVVVDEDDGRHS
jgi:hypothetical protein